MIRDVAVKVPEPDDFIAEAIFPSHIVVPRCSGRKLLKIFRHFKKYLHLLSGVCVSSAGLTCHPKKKARIVSHDVVLYNANGSQVDIGHHQFVGLCRYWISITPFSFGCNI